MHYVSMVYAVQITVYNIAFLLRVGQSLYSSITQGACD